MFSYSTQIFSSIISVLSSIKGNFKIPHQPLAITQANACRIFANKNVLFFGDSTIRSIYGDLCRLLHKDKKLSAKELERHYSSHEPYI